MHDTSVDVFVATGVILIAYPCRQVFSVGVSHYGVADCELLAQDTHKFESRYLDSLIGCSFRPPPQSPITMEFVHKASVLMSMQPAYTQL